MSKKRLGSYCQDCGMACTKNALHCFQCSLAHRNRDPLHVDPTPEEIEVAKREIREQREARYAKLKFAGHSLAFMPRVVRSHFT